MTAVDTDIQLLQRFSRTGDEQAFAAIVKRHAGMVFTTCVRVLGDAARAEEVAQETFFQLVKKGRTVNQSLGGWLHRTATRLAIDALRSDTSRARRERTHGQAEVARRGEAQTWQEIAPYVDAALADMQGDNRELLLEHFLEGVSQSELAERTGLSRPTVHRRIQTGLDQLRRRLRDMGVLVAAGAILAAFEQTAATAPRTLMSELGKMAMISGSATPAPAAGATFKATAAEVIMTAAPMTVAGGLAIAVIVGATLWWMPSSDSPKPHAGDQPHPAAIDQAAAADARGEPETRSAQSARYVFLQQDDGDLDSRRIIMFQDPASSDDQRLLVKFADTHVRRMDIDEVRRLLKEQTGSTLAELLASHPVITMDP